MIDVSVHRLVKAYEVNKNILDGLTFEVNSGERVGILGKNGAGKTTLFRLLTGELTEDEGDIVIAGGKKLGLISQIPRYPAGYTVEMVLKTAFARLDSIKKEMESLEKVMELYTDRDTLDRYSDLCVKYELWGGYETDMELGKVCNGLGISPAMRQQQFELLSGGEKTRVNLARLILEKTDILLLDEPTNHLDIHAVEWLEDYLEKFKGTVLTISHDRYFLDRVVGRIIEIVNGKADIYNGNYSSYVVQKRQRLEDQQRQYEKEQAEIKRLTEASTRLKQWGTGNQMLMKKAFAIDKRIERTAKTERPDKEKKMKARFGERDFTGDEVMVIKELSKSFEGRTLFSGLNLLVEGDDRIALVGDNGTGKSTLAKIIMEEEVSDSGVVKFGPQVRIGYLPQIVKFENPNRSLVDTMVYECDLTVQAARDRLGSFKFQGEDVFKLVSQLSGGEQSRLRLCMLMNQKINFLILDEPTNHLDIASREWIEEALEDFEGALLLISHDRYFVKRFANRMWELENRQITDYIGGYEKFREYKERMAQIAAAAAASEPKEKKKKEEHKPVKTNTRQLEKDLAKTEREIEKNEQAIAELETQIEDAASDYVKLTELYARQQELQNEAEQLMQRWTEIMEQLEG